MAAPSPNAPPTGGRPTRLVVVGTSAGGLAALRAYLRGLPQEGPQLCHIIAQHMAPRHRSRLAELLAPFTVQPVVDLEDGLRLEDGTLYIMPPAAHLHLDREGRAHLSQEENPPSPSPNINDLLHQCLGFAPQLGVAILSGTGHDGLAGAREVAAAGGVVVSEGSAEYPQMPGAIQTTGLSRFTAPPGELARYLVAALSGRLDEAPLAHLSPLEEVLQILQGDGFNFIGYKGNTLHRQLDRRQREKGLDFPAYLALLERDREERERLGASFLISVTSFFRDPDVFQALEQQLASLVARRPEGHCLRLWVPACATGDEAYSLAILVQEELTRCGRQDMDYRIFATDLADSALAVARQGVYPEKALSHLPPLLRQRWFLPAGRDFRVTPELREHLIFCRHNVRHAPPFLHMDLLSCRNLFIYLQPAEQEKLLQIFHQSLVEGGLLILGRNESVPAGSELFQVLDGKTRIYQSNPLDQSLSRPLLPGLGRPFSGDTPRPAGAEPSLSQRILDALAPNGVVVDHNGVCQQFLGEIRNFLLLGQGEANLALAALLPKTWRFAWRELLTQSREHPGECLHSVALPEGQELPVGGPFRLRLLPLASTTASLSLVLVEPLPAPIAAPDTAPSTPQVAALEGALEEISARYQLTLEQLEATNEEMQSANEELQATNEELETTTEEIRAANEELEAANEELEVRNREVQAAGEELQQLLDSSALALVVLDESQLIRRINAQAQSIFRIKSGAVGHGLDETILPTLVPNLPAMVKNTLAGQVVAPEEILLGEQSYLLRVQAYQTLGGGRARLLLTAMETTEVRKAYAALQESEQRHALAMEAAQDGIWDWTVGDNQLYVSQAFLDIIGCRRKDFDNSVGHFFDRVHPDDRDILEQANRDFLRGRRKRHHLTYRLRHEDGSFRWVETRYIALRHSDGQVFRVAGSTRDITGRKEAEDALRQREVLLQKSFDAAAIGMAITDLEGRFIRVNSALSRISGFSPKELLTRSYLDITHPDDVTEDREMDRRLVAGELPQFQRDKRYVCKNGQTRWISVSVALVSKDDGAPDYFMRQIQDIDAQKRMLDALRLSEERFRRTMVDAPIGMCLVSPEGKFLQVNQALCDLVGYSEDALLNLTFQNITHPDDLEIDLSYVGELLAGKRSHYRLEKRYIRKDGRETWVQLAVTMLRDAQEQPLYFLAEIVDIDELKHSQRDLEQSAALVEDLYNHAPIGYHSLDARGVIVHINDTELQWLGYRRDEVVGKLRFSDIITPASQTTFNSHYPTFKREGVLEDMEFEMLRKDGGSFFVLLSASAIFDAQGHYQMSRSTMVDITQRRAAEQARRRSDELFRRTMTYAPIGMLVSATAGRFLQVNPAFCNLLGYSEAELLDKGYADITHPEDREMSVRYATELLEGRRGDYRLEKRYLRKDGSPVWVLVSVALLPDMEGVPRHCVAQIVDIDRRKRMEEDLRDMGQRIDLALSAANLGTLTWDVAAGKVGYDSRLAVILNQPPGQGPLSLGEFSAMILDVDRSHVLQQLEETARQFSQCQLQFSLRRNGDQALRHLSVHLIVPPPAPDRPLLGIAIVQDITQLREAEQALQESEGRFRAKIKAEWKEDLARYRRGDINHAPLREHRVRCRDGTEKVVEINFTLYGDGIYAVFNDVTEKRRIFEALQQAMEQANAGAAAKSEFLANMSHEIRTPMNAIIGLSDLALRSVQDSRQRDYLAKIHAAGSSLLGIINDILDVTKIEAGKLSLESEPFLLHDVLARILDMLSPLALTKGLRFELDITPAVPDALEGDALRLGQVLLNLLNNAIKFTAKGFIRLSISLVGDEAPALRFAIGDSGIGLKQEQQARLFEAFSQADTSTTRRFGGTGLGLSISRRLVTMMGGTVTVRSEYRVGSEFSFTIPCREMAHPGGPAAPRLTDLELPENRIVVSSDCRQTLGDPRPLLEHCGLKVVEEAEAVPRPGELPPLHLLAWSHSLPANLEAIARLANREPGKAGDRTGRLLVVVPRGDDVPPLLRSLEGAQAIALLSYPFLPQELARVLLAPDTRPPHLSAGHSPDVRLDGFRLLVAEDNGVNQMIIREYLESAGAQVVMADNGREAVEALRQPPPGGWSAILMDVQMPEMDGITATQVILQEQGPDHPPIIALTAHALREEVDRCLAAGMVAHLTKPIEPGLLLETLHRLARPVGARIGRGAAEPVEAPRDFPGREDLPGIQVDVLLSRTNHKAHIVQQVLEATLEHHRDDPDNLVALVQSGDRATLARQAHTLKGLGGTLGAMELADRALALENLLHSEGADGTALEAATRSLGDGLAQVIGGIATYLERTRSWPPVETDLPAGERDARLARLHSALANSDGNAGNHLKSLFGALDETERQHLRSELMALEHQITEFNYEQALQDLDNLTARLCHRTRSETP